MDPYISSLLETTVTLDEGGYGYVFTIKTISEKSDISLWQCHLCDVKGADEISLPLHVQSKEHEQQMVLPSHPKKKFIVVDRKNVMKTEPRNVIRVEPDQPAPPGTEEYLEIKLSETSLQSVFDNYKNVALIGVEYVVEILRPGIGQEQHCICMLCDKKCDPRTIIGHLTSFLHRYKYLSMYFPTFTTAMQEKLPRNKAGRKQMMEIVSRVVPRIEEKFGRLHPLYAEKEENFEDRKKLIYKKIFGDNHLKQTTSETFLDVLEKSNNVFQSKVNISVQVKDGTLKFLHSPLESGTARSIHLFCDPDNQCVQVMGTSSDVKPEPTGLPKFVDVNAVEPAVPETMVRHLSQLEAVLEVHKNNPIVGLDYVAELRDENDDEHLYFCTLCEKQGDPRVTVCHLLSLKHRLKFIAQHFPKTKEVLNSKFKDDKRTLTNALKLITAKVEAKYGRKSPVVVIRKIFEFNKHIIIRKILDSNNFREPLDDTFVELIEKQMTYLKSLEVDKSEDPGNKMDLDVEEPEDEETESSNNKEKSNKFRKKTESKIEVMLKNLDKPVIGVEYLIELTSSSPNKEPVYMCAYCDKKGDPRVAMNHFTSYKHCAKYINVYFPTAKKTILYLTGTMKECKKGIGEMMMVLCAKIQEKYGWLRPRSYDEEYFERNRKTIIDEISNGDHLRETPEENFVEFVEKTLKEVNSYVDYDAPPVDIPATPADALGRGHQLFHNLFYPAPQIPLPLMPVVPQMPVPIVSAVPQMLIMPTASPVKPLRMNLPPHAVSTAPPAKRSQNILPSGRSGTRLEVPLQDKKVVDTSDTKSGRSSIEMPLQQKITPSGRPRIRLEMPLKHKKVVNTSDTNSKKKTPVDLPSLKPKLHENSRSRSNSPFEIEFGRLSPVDESLKSTVKWEMYVSKFKKLREDIIKNINYYKMNPEEHPSYAVEWGKFWNNWYDRIKSKGLDPAKQNIMPEWIEFWNKKVKDLFKQKFESMKQDIKRTYGLNALWKPVIEHHHEEEETHKDAGNKREGERSNSESPPPKQSKGFSRNKDLDRRTKEKTWEKEMSKENYRRKSRERSRERKSREKSRERKSRERSRERKPREKSRERRTSRQETQRGKSRERADDKGSRERVQYRKSRKRESSVDRVQDKKSIERERESRKESRAFEKAETFLEKSRQKDVDKEYNEESEFIKSAKIKTSLVSVLRIAAALEDQLGSLGPQVNFLLGSALSLEKMAVSFSETLLANSEHFTLLETVKEKLRGRLIAGIVDRSMVLATENCVDLLDKVLIEAEKNNTMLAISAHAGNISSTASSLKAGVLSRFAVSDIKEKAPDVQQAKNVSSVANTSIGSVLTAGTFSRVSATLPRGDIVKNSTTIQKVENLRSAASLLNKGAFSRERKTVTLPISSAVDRIAIAQEISSFLIKEGRYDVSQEELEQLINCVAKNRLSSGSAPSFSSQMQQQQQQQNQPGPSSSLSDIVEYLSINDLNNLLKNFQVLCAEEQQVLTEYLKMLEVSCPEKIEKLQESLSVNSLTASSRILTKSEHLRGLSHSVEQREQTEKSQKNIFSQSANTDVKYSFVKQFQEREKPTAELQKMTDLEERKTMLRQNNDERMKSARTQLQSYLWSQQPNQK